MKQTIQNLTKAFVGESQARNRYTFFAKIAQKDGFEQIAAIFLEIAEQEKAHAKRLFEHIQELKKKLGGNDFNEIKVEAVALTIYGTTVENLKSAIAGEKHEYTEMYPEFSKTAKKERLEKIALRLEAIAKAEEHHEQRFKNLLKEVENKTVFKKSKKIAWVCRECGYEHIGNQAPTECPSCGHPQSYYQVKCERY
ncbi:MAG: rubrerythrin family protein [bacterium]